MIHNVHCIQERVQCTRPVTRGANHDHAAGLPGAGCASAASAGRACAASAGRRAFATGVQLAAELIKWFLFEQAQLSATAIRKISREPAGCCCTAAAARNKPGQKVMCFHVPVCILLEKISYWHKPLIYLFVSCCTDISIINRLGIYWHVPF